jgi:hypothetical protein
MIAQTKSLGRSVLPRPCVLFVASVSIIFIFVLVFVRGPLWYDESIYLTLSASTRSTGYPIIFWVPEKPSLFLDSPPAILYLIANLPNPISSSRPIRYRRGRRLGRTPRPRGFRHVIAGWCPWSRLDRRDSRSGTAVRRIGATSAGCP